MRAEDQVNRGLAAHDLGPLGLGHATRHGKRHAAAGGLARRFEPTEAAELGIDLLGRLFTDMAGIEDDEIRLRGGSDGHEAERRQNLRHPGGIVSVHLASVGLDEKLLCHAHRPMG